MNNSEFEMHYPDIARWLVKIDGRVNELGVSIVELEKKIADLETEIKWKRVENTDGE